MLSGTSASTCSLLRASFVSNKLSCKVFRVGPCYLEITYLFRSKTISAFNDYTLKIKKLLQLDGPYLEVRLI
jgi:hypothetical protein